MKKFPATEIDIYLRLHDGDLYAYMVPPAKSNCAAVHECVEVTAIPSDVSAYIQFIERMVEKQ